MKFGCCIDVKALMEKNGQRVLESLSEMGYDYIELSLSSVVSLSDSDFTALKKVLDASPIKCETFNVFFPGDQISLTGELVCYDKITKYSANACKAASLLGGSIAVLGSGAARNIPDGYDRQMAIDGLIQTFCIIADEAAKHNIIIALEPLNQSETNAIVSIKEAAKFVNSVNKDNFGLLVDYYHMMIESESLENINNCGVPIYHIHFADPDGRVYPSVVKDEFISFFQTLHDIGYDNRMSLECRMDDLLNNAKVAINTLQVCMEAVN